MQPLTMCVKPEDKIVATVWGWDDRPDFVNPLTPDLNDQDRVLRGTTLVMDVRIPAPRDHRFRFAVTEVSDLA